MGTPAALLARDPDRSHQRTANTPPTGRPGELPDGPARTPRRERAEAPAGRDRRPVRAGAAADAGSGPAAFALGKLLHDQRDLAGAERWYA
ncbi:hypothetical protein ACFXMO_23040, partial [Kitasatospora indigofera]